MTFGSVNGLVPTINGHGQSDATPWKLTVFDGVIRRRLPQLVKLRRQGVLTSLSVFDLNAGSGWNRGPSGERLPGTPHLVAKALEDLDIDCRHVVIDHDRRICNALDKEWRLYGAKRICCDNGDWLATQDPGIRSGGLILCDPNGPGGLPYEELQAFSERAPFFDYLVNHNISGTERCYNGMTRLLPLVDRVSILKRFGKKYYLVGDNKARYTSWFIFFGTDDRSIQSIRRIGLYRSDTRDGQKILRPNKDSRQLELLRRREQTERRGIGCLPRADTLMDRQPQHVEDDMSTTQSVSSGSKRVRNTGNTTAKAGTAKKGTSSPRHGGLRRWFGDLEVVEATTDLRIQPNANDIKSAVTGDPTQCAFSRACQRMWSSNVVVFFATVAYVDLLDTRGNRRVERFSIPREAREFIRAFDDGEMLNPKGFILKAPSASNTVDACSDRGRRRRKVMLKGAVSGQTKRPQAAPVAFKWTQRRASFYRNGADMVHFSAKPSEAA